MAGFRLILTFFFFFFKHTGVVEKSLQKVLDEDDESELQGEKRANALGNKGNSDSVGSSVVGDGFYSSW